jgi:hypothetical protein
MIYKNLKNITNPFSGKIIKNSNYSFINQVLKNYFPDIHKKEIKKEIKKNK